MIYSCLFLVVSWVRLCDWEISEQMLSMGHTTRKGLAGSAKRSAISEVQVGQKDSKHVPWQYVRLVKNIIELVGQLVHQNRRNVLLLHFVNLCSY